ncbi:MAG TPA: hypothetical protein VIX73_06830, partial [Kofleriaceae bacterium]
PVPNAGGCPGGGAACAAPVFAARAGATRLAAAPSNAIAGPFKNCLRELAMARTVLEVGPGYEPRIAIHALDRLQRMFYAVC